MDVIAQDRHAKNPVSTVDTSSRITISDLEFEDQLKMMWGICWRGICISILAVISAAIAGGIFGGIFGIVMAVAGKDVESVKIYLQLFGGLLGAAIGFAFIFPWIKWITKVNFGQYQLRITKVQ